MIPTRLYAQELQEMSMSSQTMAPLRQHRLPTQKRARVRQRKDSPLRRKGCQTHLVTRCGGRGVRWSAQHAAPWPMPPGRPCSPRQARRNQQLRQTQRRWPQPHHKGPQNATSPHQRPRLRTCRASMLLFYHLLTEVSLEMSVLCHSLCWRLLAGAW